MSLQLFLAPRPWVLGALLGLGFLGAVLPSLERTRLQDVDELTHAKVAQNAALRGHWSPLWLDDHVFYEKPPLLPWLTALTVKASGQPYASWPYRLWPALGAAAVIGLLGALALWATGSVSLAAAAALWLALQPDFLFHARFLTHDTLFLASALAALALALRARGGAGWLWPGLALALAFAFKSWFVLALLPALAWGLWTTVEPAQRWRAARGLLVPPLSMALAWLALYTHWMGPQFLVQEWQGNLWGRALGRTTELDPEGQFSFYIKWARWSAPALALWAFALPLAWRPGRNFLERTVWALALSWVLGLCVVRAQTINYLLPLEAALCLGLALAWPRWSPRTRAWAALGLLMSTFALARQGPFWWPVPAGLGLGLVLRLSAAEGRAFLKPAWIAVLLLAFSLPQAWAMLVRPLDAHAQLAQLLLEHPAKAGGEPLLVVGPRTQAVDFYSSYQVQWLEALPAERPKGAALVKTKLEWRFYEAQEKP